MSHSIDDTHPQSHRYTMGTPYIRLLFITTSVLLQRCCWPRFSVLSISAVLALMGYW